MMKPVHGSGEVVGGLCTPDHYTLNEPGFGQVERDSVSVRRDKGLTKYIDIMRVIPGLFAHGYQNEAFIAKDVSTSFVTIDPLNVGRVLYVLQLANEPDEVYASEYFAPMSLQMPVWYE